MESVFDAAGNAAILERINNLTPASKPLWGKMTVSQMLAHSQRPIEVAFGQTQLKRGLLAILFGGWAKKRYLAPGPLPHGDPTAPGFKVTDPGLDFENERRKLLQMVAQFTKGPSSIANPKHPFFGEMTPQEWDRLQWKHLDHHLRQFGV